LVSTTINTTIVIKPVGETPMRCEVCGRKIHGSPLTAEIEGARLTVCTECSKHGRILSREEIKPKIIVPNQKAVPITSVPVRKKPEAKVEITQEVVEGYPQRIRHAREKLGLSHEELAKKINEKESVLRKLETGKMEPNDMLVTKLEHALKIKLLTPIAPEEPKKETSKPSSRELTLGDLIQLGKKGEEPAKRKPS
jgi:putative transcription factor